MSLSKIIKGFIRQKRVLDALRYRELKTRISKTKFGFFGLLLQPIGVLLLFLFIFGFIRRRGVGNLDPSFVPIYLLCGIIHFTLFSEIVIRSLNSMQANSPLFIYRQVKPIDTLLSRAYLEIIIYVFVFIIMITGVFLIFETFLLDNLPLVFVSYILLALTSFGLGTIFMVAGHRYEILKIIIPFIQRPLFLTSGIFFSIKDLPPKIIPWLSWNPVLQAIELSRSGFNEKYILDPSIISLKYLFSFSLISCVVGFWVYFNNLRILRKL